MLNLLIPRVYLPVVQRIKQGFYSCTKIRYFSYFLCWFSFGKWFWFNVFPSFNIFFSSFSFPLVNPLLFLILWIFVVSGVFFEPLVTGQPRAGFNNDQSQKYLVTNNGCASSLEKFWWVEIKREHSQKICGDSNKVGIAKRYKKWKTKN